MDIVTKLKQIASKLEAVVSVGLSEYAELVKKNAETNYGSYKLAKHIIIQNGFLEKVVLVDKDYAYFS